MNAVTLAPGLTLIHGDCMEYLATLPDGAVDLAVVDPPYGIGASSRKGRHIKGQNPDKYKTDKYKTGDWDSNTPSRSYFGQLRRVSNNQIIWGANHFANNLPVSRGWVFWDKKPIVPNYSDGELAWTSFDCVLRRIEILWNGKIRTGIEPGYTSIHPTQKPVALYRWLLQNYAKPGQTILDTHLGSGSSAIAAWEMGYAFTGIEIDKDYFNAAVERIQKRLLSPYLPGIAGNEGRQRAEQLSCFSQA